ncbi:lipoyl(octanoyl) transferase LipB [Clostridium sp.]|uniref:lipoyl(octanoyl) transferase LipB n=1 Tax=Clostridium sp. TaxID=1506 RepID=UPI001A58D4A1|nr:lipoyl(octanoyl) transferase LipB [Clostridium sp.]MBK5236048.1 lipoyl(octanoyl) transferase LipB [Clostridium sp.]
MDLSVIKLGLIEYQEAYDLQMKILKLSQQEAIGNVLLILEHPTVLTVGINGKDNNILVKEDVLHEMGVGVFRSNRGGDVTYHGPGQVVAYPIINLNHFGKDVKNYVRLLEETSIGLIKEEYGLIADRKPGFPGVWVGNNKITAIGCAVKRWVTMHGFALNVNTNLEHFKLINPCGFTDKGVTSLEKLLGESQDIDIAINHIIKHFSDLFSVKPQIIDKKIFLKKVGNLYVGE